MGAMQVSPYSEANAKEWDQLVERCPATTFLHTRRFLSYHGDRFKDVSLILRDDEQRTVGLFPAAVDPKDRRIVASHPGITFGGLLHAGALYGQQMFEALAAVRQHYADDGFELLRYKAVPYIYHQQPSSDDLYALFRIGARRYRCDLSCAIDLERRREPTSRRKRGFKKALKHGLEIADGLPFIEEIWRVLEENLDRKHGVKPVHDCAEITYLHSLFPANIKFAVGLLNGQVVAGITLFIAPPVVHAQYIASSSAGYEVCALDALLEHCIGEAKQFDARYFDFGISNEDEGNSLNSGLYQFKIEFGAGGVVHEFYEIALTASPR
jgi:hypothetical protein